MECNDPIDRACPVSTARRLDDAFLYLRCVSASLILRTKYNWKHYQRSVVLGADGFDYVKAGVGLRGRRRAV